MQDVAAHVAYSGSGTWARRLALRGERFEDFGVFIEALDRVRALRRKLALELGLVLPPVRTRDDLELPMSTYRIRLHGVEVARGEAPPDHLLAIGDGLDALPGRATREPVFGLAAKWVITDLRHQAEMSGATVVDRASVITTHLSEVVRDNAARLLGREDVRMLVDAVKRSHPIVVEELTPALLTLGEIQRVLQSLLEDRVPVRDLVRIFEALSQRARTSTDQEGLVEAARATLGPAICVPLATDGVLHVLTLDPMLEQGLLEAVRAGDAGTFLLMDSERLATLVSTTAALVNAAQETGLTPVLVCSPQIRAALRRIMRAELPALSVISYSELGGSLDIQTIGAVDLAHAPAA
jgi:flagellar biosynthesis protein FlhA